MIDPTEYVVYELSCGKMTVLCRTADMQEAWRIYEENVHDKRNVHLEYGGYKW